MPIREEISISYHYCKKCGAKVETGTQHTDADCIAHLKVAADKWNALMSIARFRPLGCAGIIESRDDGYAHLGLEMWTQFEYDSPNEETNINEKASHERGIEWLERFVKVAGENLKK